MKIVVLVDNISETPDLQTEHGLSIWIETDSHRILFDTGKSDLLEKNALCLGVDLSAADIIVLSHGHYDHTGGIAGVLEKNGSAAIYCHSGIFTPRYSRQDDGKMKPVGICEHSSTALDQAFERIHFVDSPVFLSEKIGITGPIPRNSDFENTGGDFYFDTDATRPDIICDDLALWIKTDNGLYVICGCSHSGLVNTLCYISTLTGITAFHTVIGGFHLLHASGQRMEKTCGFLSSITIRRMVPCHCTGVKQVELLKDRFGSNVDLGMAGKIII
ncbi:MAG TPA: MBL fold metallo-hydrolase [Chitinispirillaceae bacterium]|nr:MBL fold metallo-hydrolase [Chitinispirillaceae bacterium]